MNKDQCITLISIIGGLLLLWLLLPCNKHKKNNENEIIMIVGKNNNDKYVRAHNWNDSDSDLYDCLEKTCCLDGQCRQNSKIVNDRFEIDHYNPSSIEILPYDISTQNLSPLELTGFYTPYENDNYINREERDMERVAF